MKKPFFYGLATGLVIGATFVGATTNVFASVGQKIEATFADFNFKVNGSRVEVASQPIVYNGSTYLPVRTFSELLNYNVKYEDSTRTVELSIQQDETVKKPVNNSISTVQPNKENVIFLENYSVKSVPVKAIQFQQETFLPARDAADIYNLHPLTIDNEAKTLKFEKQKKSVEFNNNVLKCFEYQGTVYVNLKLLQEINQTQQ